MITPEDLLKETETDKEVMNKLEKVIDEHLQANRARLALGEPITIESSKLEGSMFLVDKVIQKYKQHWNIDYAPNGGYSYYVFSSRNIVDAYYNK